MHLPAYDCAVHGVGRGAVIVVVGPLLLAHLNSATIDMTPTEIDKKRVEYAYSTLSNLPKGTEYEKMILGMAYNCWVKELLMARSVAHEKALDYGNIRLKDYDFDIEKHQKARHEYLATIFGNVPKDAFIEPPFFVDYGCNVSFGKCFYANFNCTFLDPTFITFGDYCMLGPNVTFTTFSLPSDPKKRINAVEHTAPITVGNNVWFAANTVILPGVTIGDGAVIAAGAVVRSDVPANCVVAGVPAKVVKSYATEEEKKDAFVAAGGVF
jgi:acetyltransferase-like isoleucine patch superfamily enzyme